MTAHSISFSSLNVKGFNAPNKRSQILFHFHKLRTEILFLQETHFQEGRVPHLHNKFYDTWVHSLNPTSKSKGVSIAFHKSIQPEIIQRKIDSEGRFILLRIRIYGVIYTLANVYFPNTQQVAFLSSLVRELEEFGHHNLILGGDFNLALLPRLDCSSGRSAVSQSHLSRIRRYLTDLSLVDVWRVLHPDERDYTFHSFAHDTLSRIDYFFVSQTLLDASPSSSIGVRLWSDHAPIHFRLGFARSGSRSFSWRLNDNLLMDALCKSAINDTIETFVLTHRNDDSHPLFQWAALKCVLRGVLIQHGARLKKARSVEIASLLQRISHLERLHKQSPSPLLLADLSAVRRELLHLLDQRSLVARDKARAHFYEHANKPGSHLARTLHPRSQRAPISFLSTPAAAKLHSNSAIASTFRDYYEALYNLPSSPDYPADHLRQYMSDTSLPTLDGPTSQSLETPFSPDEVTRVIKSLKSGKCPGPDGFSVRFYKSFAEILAPLLSKTFNSIDDAHPFLPEMLEARIVVLPKPGKDLSQCSSYRPISLLNVDIKIYSKIIADRLSPCLPSLIHDDQVGFVPGREASDNTTKTIHLISHVRRKGLRTCLLSFDAEKAFDRVSWPFLRLALEQVKLGPILRSRILSLYSYPSAHVSVNGICSNSFPIRNGTRQGCPLSPLLFTIVIEHLAQAIRQNASIQGIHLAPSHCKLSLYADDLLLYISNPHVSIPSLFAEFHRFSRFSNFKLNMHKTEALNISLTQSELASLRANFPFQWKSRHIRYLGVSIPSDLSELYTCNYTPLLHSIRETLRTWRPLRISWFGKLNALKMDILPKILYIFQTVPINLSRSFFTTLRSLTLRAIWTHGVSRVRFRTLCRSKSSGGVSLPNFELYHKATLLSRMTTWFYRSPMKGTVAVEQHLSTLDLRSLPWLHEIPTAIRVCLSPLTQAALKVWHRSIIKHNLSSIPGPLSSLFDNPSLSIGVRSGRVGGYRRRHWPQAREFVDTSTGQFRPPSSSSHTGPVWLEKAQLSSFCRSLYMSGNLGRPLTGFEQLCSRKSPPRHTLSYTYQLLITPETAGLPGYVEAWHHDLEATFPLEEWERTFYYTHKSSLSCYTQEKNYKLLSRWYKVPVFLHHIFPQVPDTCWRCGKERGTYLHIWWSCSGVQQYWSSIFSISFELCGMRYTPSPEFALLSMFPGPRRNVQRSLLRFIFSAARQVIPAHWKTSVFPNISHWVQVMNEMMRAEEIIAIAMDDFDRFYSLWASWISFSTSDSLRHMLR